MKGLQTPFLPFSPEGQYTFANQAIAEGFGKPAEEIIGRTIWDFFSKDEADRRFSFLREAFITGERKIIEGPVPNPNGTRYYMTTITPIKNSKGDVVSAFCSSKDITDRRLMEESLQEAYKKLHFLTGLTRHDIFNQITIMQGFLLFAMEESDLETSHEYITQAYEASKRMGAIIGFTREYEAVGIESSDWQKVYQVIESAKSEVALGDVTVYNQIPEYLEVYADPIIRKVFTTLLENAVRHGGDLTYIRFSITEISDTLTILCEDDGIGVPFEEKKYIFNHGYGKHTGNRALPFS